MKKGSDEDFLGRICAEIEPIIEKNKEKFARAILHLIIALEFLYGEARESMLYHFIIINIVDNYGPIRDVLAKITETHKDIENRIKLDIAIYIYKKIESTLKKLSKKESISSSYVS